MAAKYKRKEVPKNLLLPGDISKYIDKLEREAAGDLLKAAYKYYDSDEEPEFDDIALGVLFTNIKNTMDYGRNKYEKTCEENTAKRAVREKKEQKRKELGEFLATHSINDFATYCDEDPEDLEYKLTTGIKALTLSDLENYLYLAQEMQEEQTE